MRHHGDADVGFDQLDQVALVRNLVAMLDAVFAQVRGDAARMLAEGPTQQLLRAQIVQFDAAAAGQPMSVANDELEALGEQRPGVEPVPGLVDLGGDAELGFSLLEEIGDLAARPAQEAQFEPVELPPDLVEVRNQQCQVDRMCQRDAQRADFTAPERGGERARADRGIIALLQERMHALAELGQLCRRSLAAKQVAAELGLELLDRARQRGLRDVALLRRAREIEQLRHREEIADLVHFHGSAPSKTGWKT